MNEKIDIEAYIRIYEQGIPVSRIKPLKNQTYKVFLLSSKANVRVANRTMLYRNPTAFDKIKHFVQTNEYFYMVPIMTIRGSIAGFIIRGIFNSDYVTLSREFSSYETKVPLMYGFHSFKSFDLKDKAFPVVVCEGCKDCLTIKQFYPYVLANNTSSMGINAYILRNISNKFLLAYDNDNAGKEGMERDRATLESMGAQVDTVAISNPELKDCTDCFLNKDGSENTVEFKKLKKQVLRKLDWLYRGV